jgi:spermidine/putrescine transport system ATP-binding protein
MHRMGGDDTAAAARMLGWPRFPRPRPWDSVAPPGTKAAAMTAPGAELLPSARGKMTDEVVMTGNSSTVRDDDTPMLEIRGVTHFYGTTLALDDVSLSARRGEFLTILGESGSGKTTMLRIISGLERPTEVARLAIDGEEVSGKPAAMRNCTTVFQHYALFPHMSAGENAGYGLKVRGVPQAEARHRVQEMLRLVRMSDKENRRIHQLSGGERQRIALARALITHPAILLLDEPLGALDEKLRLDMQSELVDLHRKLGMTFVYITHSQEEALTMSDRVILMRKGRIEQSGTPEALFDRPTSRFAADFMGFDNILPATIRDAGGRAGEEFEVVAAVGPLELRGRWTGAAPPRVGDKAFIAMRAERLVPVEGAAAAAARGNRVQGEPGPRVYRGKYVDQIALTPLGPLKIRIWERKELAARFDAVFWSASDCVVLPE